jgi:hypothetical protein
MRDPSIHVKRSDLSKAIKSLWDGVEDKEIDMLIKKLRRKSCDNRSVVISNEKLKKDMSKRLASNKGDASLLSDVIYSVRIKLKHRGIRRVTQEDREWLQVKQLAKVCNQFCEEFEMEKRAGYIKYIELAISKISSFHSMYSKFINMYESIVNEYDASHKLIHDSDKQTTLSIHDYFVSKVADKTGIYSEFKDKPNKMLKFMEIRELCENLSIDYEVFIDAQFEALDWCNGLPTPEVMVTDKAKERLQKYMYQHKITTKTPTTKVDSGFWAKLKNHE